MRNEPNLRIETYRDNSDPAWASPYGKNWGRFFIPTASGCLRILSSGFADKENPWGKGWEHVSVSLVGRTPTWEEMDRVKKLFWRDDETVVQFHPREDAKINYHPSCLHLWKLTATEFVLPPKELIA